MKAKPEVFIEFLNFKFILEENFNIGGGKGFSKKKVS